MSQEHDHFIVPTKYYVLTFIGLLLLTTLTVVSAEYLHLLGSFNIVIAMVIAFIKASLVLLYFMGLRWDKKKLNIAFFLSALVVLAIFISFTVFDVGTRGKLNDVEKGKINYDTPVKIEKN